MLLPRSNNTKYLSVINTFPDNTDGSISYRSARTDTEEQLHQLVIKACQYLPRSAERQKSLTKIIRLISDKLWQENTPYYQDALQQTWVYFCQNLCERNTGEPYDPSCGSVVTWVNGYLKERLQELYIENQKQQAKKVAVGLQMSELAEVNETLNIDNLEAYPHTSSLLKEIITWVETDPKGKLRCLHIEGYPKITCQELLRRRLPPVTSWQALAAEFHLPVLTLSSFYQQQCIPCLRQFRAAEEYL